MSTWEFAHTGQIWIEDPLPDFTLQRINNQHLTEIFIKAGVTGKLLRRLNQCRLYLQVTRLADITTGDGLEVTKRAQKGELDSRRLMYY